MFNLIVISATRSPEKAQTFKDKGISSVILDYDAKTMDEVAQILTETVGQPFKTETHPPKEFLDNALQAGVAGINPNAYMNCVYTQFELNAADKIPEADRTFDNFEAITGRKPNTWRDFAINYRDQLAY